MIGGQENNNSCELFDSFTRKFSFVKKQFVINEYSPNVCIGKKIYYFEKEGVQSVYICSYDVEKNTFGLKTWLKMDNNNSFSCTKVPMQ